jgi:hypothetical protein
MFEMNILQREMVNVCEEEANERRTRIYSLVIHQRLLLLNALAVQRWYRGLLQLVLLTLQCFLFSGSGVHRTS